MRVVIANSDVFPKSGNARQFEFWQWTYEPFFWRFASNLAALISIPEVKLPRDAWRNAPLLRSAIICSERLPGPAGQFHPSRFVLSTLLHCVLATVGVLWPTLADWNEPPRQATVKELLDNYSVLYYTKADLLPAIAPAPAPPSAVPANNGAANIPENPDTSSPRVKLSPARTTQPIASQQPRPDNRRQTIVQPDAPDIRIPDDVKVPNLLAVRNEMPAPPPPIPNLGQQRLSGMSIPSRPQPPPPQPSPKMPPPPPLRKADPDAPSLRAENIRASNIEINLVRTDDVPTFPVPVAFSRPVPPPPVPRPIKQMPSAPRPEPVGALNARNEAVDRALSEPAIRMSEMPTVPVPVSIQRRTPVAPKPREIVARPMPDAPAFMAGLGNASSAHLPTLISASVDPPPPSDEIKIPVGNRSGVFTAAVDGVWTQGGGVPEGADLGRPWSDDISGGTPDSAEVSVAGLAVSGDQRAADASLPPFPIVQRGREALPNSPQNQKQLLASLSRPNLRPDIALRGKPVEDEYFGLRRVYTAHVNMPNLTSRTGSWVLRFAEPRGAEAARGKLSTPQVLRKVDPAYAAGAQREHIEGMVMLAALVLRDGTVANIRVVRSLDQRLDLSAISALTQWKFQPAMRDGRPVELEVLVQIPFAAQ